MKRALIVASVGILASTVWVAAANAQANINQNLYPVTPGARGASQAGGGRYAAPGPHKPGAMGRTPVRSRPNEGSRHGRRPGGAPARFRLPPAVPGPKGCCLRQHAGAVSSCSRPDAKAQGGIVAVIQTRAV